MCAHYKQPVLLIEFEEHKSFSLELVSEMKSYVKPSGKYPAKKGAPTGKGQGEPGASTLSAAQQGLQGKLVLLLLAFPRVRVIWSSSPYASADIFSDLKRGEPEPDPAVAILVGAPNDGGEEGDGAGAGNAAGEELLRTLPGINSKNVGTVMSRVRSVRELCGMSLKEVQDVLGKEEGRMCWGFIHKGEK
jgi:DNA excision repair protein ERCC-4